jgi:hypothetical protein
MEHPRWTSAEIVDTKRRFLPFRSQPGWHPQHISRAQEAQGREVFAYDYKIAHAQDSDERSGAWLS